MCCELVIVCERGEAAPLGRAATPELRLVQVTIVPASD